VGNRSTNDSKPSGLTKIGKGRYMFLLFVRGGRSSLSTEEPAKTSRWTEAVFLIIICLVTCAIVAAIWKFFTPKN
jgi:hypothetical protein